MLYVQNEVELEVILVSHLILLASLPRTNHFPKPSRSAKPDTGFSFNHYLSSSRRPSQEPENIGKKRKEKGKDTIISPRYVIHHGALCRGDFPDIFRLQSNYAKNSYLPGPAFTSAQDLCPPTLEKL